MEILDRKIKDGVRYFDIRLALEEVLSHEDQALDVLRKDLELPGFRKGRVPREIAREHLPQEKIFTQTVNEAVHTAVNDLLRAERMEILGAPRVELLKVAQGNPLEFRVFITTIPEVILGDWKSVRVRMNPITVEEKEVEAAIARLQKSRAKFLVVTRPCLKGDLVEVDFSTHADGEKLEGAEAEHFAFVLGEGHFVPGFEAAIVGMRSGQEKQFSVSVPADYPTKNIAAKTLQFSVRLHSIQQRILPILNDDFAKGLGNFLSMEDLRKSIREGLRLEKEKKERNRLRVAVLEKVMEQAKVDVPPLLVEQEQERMLSEFRNSIEAGGAKLEEYLARIGKSEGDLRRNWHDAAKRRAKAALCLRAIAQGENVVATDEEVAGRSHGILAQRRTVGDAAAAVDPEALKAYARSVILNEKVFEILEKIATLNERS